MANSFGFVRRRSNLQDCTYAVRVGEEPNSRHDRQSNMIPAERCFIDLSKSHATPFIGVGDVGLFR